MQILRYITLSIVGLLAGVITGCLGGLALAWLLALGYHRHGPSDPGDAPVYVAMGLMLIGVCVGAIAGFVIAVVYSVRLARKSKLTDALQSQ